MNQIITNKYLRNLLNNLSEGEFDDYLVEIQYSTLIVPTNEFSGIPLFEFRKEKHVQLFIDINEFNWISMNAWH